MFTGIIETTGKVIGKVASGGNLTLQIVSEISPDLKIDQSVSHDGICLTVIERKDSWHRVTAVHETIVRSNIKYWESGAIINLERCLRLNDRLDGHIVQGHVDTTAICSEIIFQNGSWLFGFNYDPNFDGLLVQKGSVAVNGTSLTVVNPTKGQFFVAIIPYTFEHTNFKTLEKRDIVNIEFDLVGKYILKNWSLGPIPVK